jgi:RNA polymerase sigma factor (sigma-70 family)
MGMPPGSMNRLLGHLRRIAAAPQPPSDGELLSCFIERREESAFAALLRRHGPMVLGVCRRVLRDVHDADDAFQATFLVLVRKAASVRPREAVGNWLYGVAYRTALEARAKIARRHAREKPMDDLPQPEAKPQAGWHELLPLLDEELHRLPDKYRLAVVLCDVEGRSRKEVARQLAIPEGTLSSRLAVARKRLAARLARLGFALSGASLAVLLAENAAPACVPAPLLLSTTRAALLVAAGHTAAAGVVSVAVSTLTEGVLKTMFVAKLKTVSVVLSGVVVLGLSTGGLLYQTRAGAADPLQQGQQRALSERAELERKKAEEELRALRERLAKAEEEARLARQRAEEVLYAQNVRQAQQELASNREERKGLDRLAELQATARERFKKERQELMERLKRLEALERETLEKFEAERRELQRQPNAPQPAAGAADKLDQILQRLERLERRLERLEQGAPSSGRKK